ncbi:MAG: endonuclease/exonuclease/phosphatase family protein [Ignavibacteriales bacterium]|nr:endonuclease/exonuclease/phosphatase family protein [Ignavibacteriales bacterium]
MQLTITTFNVENLFNRYAFLDSPWDDRNYDKFIQAIGVVSIASRAGDLVPYQISEIQRNNTAQAILDSKPDILAVQEIENIYTLRVFNETYLDNYFDRMICIDGNDPRGIDVGLLLRKDLNAEIQNIRTHIDEPENGKSIHRTSFLNSGYWVTGAIFSRDCLEVDIKLNGKIITLLINHFKAQDKTISSVARRTKQSERVAELVTQCAKSGKLPIVLGDLNAIPIDKSLVSLLKHTLLKDPFPHETWTHYYVPKKNVSRLDYILIHKTIKSVSTHIVRNGLTAKCKKYDGPRYPTIGQEHTEASDHCPVSIQIEV